MSRANLHPARGTAGPSGGNLIADDGGPLARASARNRLNDLSGREWVFSTRSVITKQYPPSHQHHLRRQHGAPKPPELCRDLICTFTKRGMRVLDPLMGVGGTLLGAALCGREALGIEWESRWIELYRQVCALEGLAVLETICADCREVLPTLPEDSFDFVLTDVPYWKMDKVSRSQGRFKRAGEPTGEVPHSTLHPFDSRAPQSKQAWLEMMGDIFALCRKRLRPRKYLAVFVGDMYHAGQYHCLSAELAQVIAATGLVWKANLVWYNVCKDLHLYGYRYAFIPSLVHQNILVFRRE